MGKIADDMDNENTIKEIIELLEENFDCSEKYQGRISEVVFDTPVIVKKCPHTEFFRCYGAATKDNRLCLLNPAGEWFEVRADQFNVEYVVNSLLQRLKTIIHVGS